MSGRMLDERLGKWGFWLTFIGFNVAFLPMHLTGLFGMPRRIYTYGPDFGWSTLNMITTVGSFILAFGILLLVINVIASLRRGAVASANPWDAPTLEWATPSPPRPYNFVVMPTVASRHPLWEDAAKPEGERSSITRGPALDNGRETLGTSVLDAEPEAILVMPEDSYAPLILALSLAGLFVAMLMQSLVWGIVAFIIGLLSIIAWLWPTYETFEPVGAVND
jgi:cytochrome c oxidase subunit 1/cytochrome c oxidase subunit I+III